LEEKRIISVSHYVTRYVRVTPGLIKSHDDVDALLREFARDSLCLVRTAVAPR
jgi:hypothetical protein